MFEAIVDASPALTAVHFRACKVAASQLFTIGEISSVSRLLLAGWQALAIANWLSPPEKPGRRRTST